MTSPWSDLSRPPLSQARITRALRGSGLWRDVRVVPSTASTNLEVAAAARAAEPAGLVVIAEAQTAGRGRLGREWRSPPRAAALLSALVRPTIDVSAWQLLPLLTGLAAVEAVASVGAIDATLKWPNDIMVDERKLGGILLERVGDAAVVGIGINVSTRAAELPVETATSLALAGGGTDREILVTELLRALERRYLAWHDTDGAMSSVIPAYRERCETIGQHVEVQLPGGELVQGVATDVDDGGRLVVRDHGTGIDRPWLVGDVTHVRKAD